MLCIFQDRKCFISVVNENFMDCVQAMFAIPFDRSLVIKAHTCGWGECWRYRAAHCGAFVANPGSKLLLSLEYLWGVKIRVSWEEACSLHSSLFVKRMWKLLANKGIWITLSILQETTLIAPDGVLANRLILLVDFWKLDHLTIKSLHRGVIIVLDVFLCCLCDSRLRILSWF